MTTEPTWNVESLRIYLEHEIQAIRAQVEQRHETETEALEAAFASHLRAIEKADAANEKRFDAVNEFRAQLGSQSSTFMPRAESIAKHEATGEKLDGQIALVATSLQELRGQMAGFMPRSESESHDSNTLERLRELELRQQSYPNREETALALSAADAKSAAEVKALGERNDSLSVRVSSLDNRVSSRLDVASGKSMGYSSLFGWGIAALTLVISVIVAANALAGK